MLSSTARLFIEHARGRSARWRAPIAAAEMCFRPKADPRTTRRVGFQSHSLGDRCVAKPRRRFPLCFQASGWISGPLARARFLLQIQRPLDFRTTRSARPSESNVLWRRSSEQRAPTTAGLSSTHIHGAHAPVEEPSTASIADIASKRFSKHALGPQCGRERLRTKNGGRDRLRGHAPAPTNSAFFDPSRGSPRARSGLSSRNQLSVVPD